MRRAIILLVALWLYSVCSGHAIGRSEARSAPAYERGMVALDQALRDLSNPYTVMSVAAHPENLDYGTLAYYRKRLGARAIGVIATRGESGQGFASKGPDDAPGVTRTREALEAARLAGADVYFLNLRDFGHSKSAEESLGVWGRDEALEKLVRAIRLLRPDVIIMGSDTRTGHGHQRAIEQLVGQAYEAAADPKRFPEAGPEAWQVHRVFRKTDEANADVRVNLDQYDQIRGQTYAQIALSANSLFSARKTDSDSLSPEPAKAYYKLVQSISTEGVPPGGTLIQGLALPENLARAITPPRVGDNPLIEAAAMRDRLVEALIERLLEKRAEGAPEELHERYGAEFFRMLRYTETLERAITLALGLSFRVVVTDPVVVPGQKLTARLLLQNGSDRVLPVVFHLPDSLKAGGSPPSMKASDVIEIPTGLTTRDVQFEIPVTARPTLPDWAVLYEDNYYPVGSTLPDSQAGKPFGNRLLAYTEVSLGQTTLLVPAEARYTVAPQVEMSSVPAVLLRNWSETRDVEINVRVRNRMPGELAGALWVVPLALAREDYEPLHMKFAREDEEQTVRLRIKLPILKPPLSPDLLIEFRREKPAPPDALGVLKILVKAIDYEVAEGVNVGFIRGFGTWISLALSELGVRHEEVSINDLKASAHGDAEASTTSPQTGIIQTGCAGISRFDTIIIEELAYTANPELFALGECMLEYVKRGGNLVVFYQNPEPWNLVGAFGRVSPFPIRLSSGRINAESAPVKILDFEHPLMSSPNKITEKDFEGWVEQQAVFLPANWGDEYAALMQSNDPGEEPQKGGLLVARYGEGSYIYASYDLRRQLLAMNAGAYRVLANLISLPKTLKKTAVGFRAPGVGKN